MRGEVFERVIGTEVCGCSQGQPESRNLGNRSEEGSGTKDAGSPVDSIQITKIDVDGSPKLKR